MRLLPREHGAYGQLAFPLITAMAVAGVSTASALIAVTTIAAFLAHEPAIILIGRRGTRSRRDLGQAAAWWLACLTVTGVLGAIGAWMTMAPDRRWSLVVPLVPALAVAAMALRGREKSLTGEVVLAAALSLVAMPSTLAGGRTIATALAIAVPFAVLFVAGTLAVRVVILRVRGGGDPRAAAGTRFAVFGFAGGAALALLWATAATLLPAAALIAAGPGLVIAVAIATRPPAPTRLKRVGWTLVAASAFAAAAAIVGMH